MSFITFLCYRLNKKEQYLAFMKSGADAINISGLLVKESRLLNPKKLGNFFRFMALINTSGL